MTFDRAFLLNDKEHKLRKVPMHYSRLIMNIDLSGLQPDILQCYENPNYSQRVQDQLNKMRRILKHDQTPNLRLNSQKCNCTYTFLWLNATQYKNSKTKVIRNYAEVQTISLYNKSYTRQYAQQWND